MNEMAYKLNEIKVEVTHYCPLRCIHCSSESSNKKQTEITWTKFIKIAEEARSMNVNEMALSGGEPLTWPNIIDAVGLVNQYGIRTLLYTSGNVADSYKIFKALKRKGLGTAIFSLYGSKEDKHEDITKVVGSFKHTVDSIANAMANKISCELHFVPMAKNYQELSKVATLAKKMGIKQVSVLRLVPQGRSAINADLVLNQSQNIELRRTIRALRDSGHKIRLGSPYNSLMLTKNPKCYSGVDRLTISPDLKISPCDAFKNVSPESLGVGSELSTLESCSLPEAWQRSPFLQKIRNYLESDHVGECATCNMLKSCLSGCAAQKYYKYGYLARRPDPMCLRKAIM